MSNVTLGGFLLASNSITTKSNVTVGNDLYVEGNIETQGTVSTTNSQMIGSNIYLGGYMYTSNDIITGSNLTVYNNLYVKETWLVNDMRQMSNIQPADLDWCYSNVSNLQLSTWTPTNTTTTIQVVGWTSSNVETMFNNTTMQMSNNLYSDCKMLNTHQLIGLMYGTVQKLQNQINAILGRLSNAKIS